MFERFTERARHSVVLAQDEARALNHDHVGSEHLLLGLLREEEGLAAQVLESLDITIEKARAQVAHTVEAGDAATTDQIPFTPRARKVFEQALREAVSFGHNYIGTEHILLALVHDNGGHAARILRDLDADANRIRAAMTERFPQRPRGNQASRLSSLVLLDFDLHDVEKIGDDRGRIRLTPTEARTLAKKLVTMSRDAEDPSTSQGVP